MIATIGGRRLDTRTVLALLVALVVGIGVALIDSRPAADDTGVSAVLLALGAALAAWISGRSPWLWAMLVGIWTPAIEIPASGATGSLLALVFAAIGATFGFAGHRAFAPGDRS